MTKQTKKVELIWGDCLEKLKTLDKNSVDSVITDPPYGLSFMGKNWDKGVPGVVYWKEVLRVLKPGGHLLSFGGSRTYHRMAVAIEDAGFEIRDQIMWVYGQGFPKSHNIGKAVDKLQGNEREVVGKTQSVQFQEKGYEYKGDKKGSGFDNKKYWGFGNDVTKGNSPYEGWGTALKPAHEPIVVARKPLSEKTIAKNVLRWGTGGINIDGCRVGNEEITVNRHEGQSNSLVESTKGKWKGKQEVVQGRFPANFIHDGSDEVIALLKDKARFFYCAKASRREKGEGNNHPTVKPIKLIQYLVKLITPPGGIVLDPFMGSGTTGIACKKEGFGFVGIELNEEYFKIAKARIEALQKEQE